MQSGDSVDQYLDAVIDLEDAVKPKFPGLELLIVERIGSAAVVMPETDEGARENYESSSQSHNPLMMTTRNSAG